MHTITAKISDELYIRLSEVAKRKNREASHLIKKAVELFLTEEEDYFIALDRLEKNHPRLSLEEIEKSCDLES
ncbi:MAG: anti-toxin [Pseudomonadota bacterium]